jgi:acetyltransferase-like isoleucine patch superfamily enzyme
MSTGAMLEHDWFPRPLPANVTLGERSWCYSSFAFLHYQSRRPCGVRVGHDSGIYHGTFFELGPDGEVEIGNYCTLVGVIMSANSRVVIEDYAFLAHEVVLADSFAARPVSARAENNASLGTGGQTALITVGENSWIGARAVLLSGARIGKGAIVGAAALVDSEVPPFAIVAGNPARIVGWANEPAPGKLFHRGSDSEENKLC